MNQYQKLFLVCDSADQFIKDSKDPDKQSEFIQFSILNCLLSAEKILDIGRNTVAATGEAGSEDKRAINQKMDNLRSDVSIFLKDLTEKFGREKVMEYLQSRARGIQTEWVGSL